MPDQELFIQYIIFGFRVEVHDVLLFGSRFENSLHFLVKLGQWVLCQGKNPQLFFVHLQRVFLVFIGHLVEFSQEGDGLQVIKFVFVALLSHNKIIDLCPIIINNTKQPMKAITVIIIIAFIFLKVSSSLSQLVKVLNTTSHKSNCYTQGLFFLNSTHLFETCGMYNESYFHILKYTANPFGITEVYSSQVPWKMDIFMEGAVLFKDFIYVLTWRENVVYKLNASTYKIVSEIKWKRQGWGLTHNGTHMFTTDGTDYIFVVDKDFNLVDKKAIITPTGNRLYNINELEYVDGFIFANIYLDSRIAKIDYNKGKVVTFYDGSELIKMDKAKKALNNDEVINGIAYNPVTRDFILTGKRWSQFYRVSFNEVSPKISA